MEPMGSQGVAKGGPKDALVGPWWGLEGPRAPMVRSVLGKARGLTFWGAFWDPFARHFCSMTGLFFIKKSTGFQVAKWIKNGSQNDSIFCPNSILCSMKIYIDFLIDF